MKQTHIEKIDYHGGLFHTMSLCNKFIRYSELAKHADNVTCDICKKLLCEINNPKWYDEPK